LAEAVQTLRQALEANQQAQATQGAQLAQIAEAARQSVEQATHLVESAVVGEGARADLLRHTPGRHASVAAFRTTGEAGANPEAFAQADREVLDALESEHPVETLTLDSFFPGSANAFTFKLSRAVASSPGGEYNPFFLFGAVGLGKTHLISGIGNAILANHPKSRVGYVSASHFSRRLTEAMRESALDAFRENYCHWDVLILDDIQFLGGRVEAQEEFFHIFNVLHQQRRQIIIASDKAPDRLGLLEQRLVSRFASGIVAELKAPEWETRMQILRHHAARAKVPVPDEILSLIAMRVPNDIRKMTGSLRKIVAFAQLVGQDLSCEMADEILSHLGAVAAA
jgi:chromosomal replication initiator protein